MPAVPGERHLSVGWFLATGSVTPYAVMQFGGIGLVAALAVVAPLAHAARSAP
jgi:hypothetical protein